MAIVDAVASGNWSNFAVTFGGIEPQPGDIVRSNGFTVTLDVDVDVAELLSTGGGFSILGQTSRTINAKLRSVSSELMQFNSACDLTVNGDVEAGSPACIRIGSSHPSTLIINGNVTGSVLGSGGSGIRANGSIYALIINGNVINVTGGNSWGIIYEGGNIPTTVNGDLIPGPQAAIWNQHNGSITVNGTSFGHPTLTSGGAGYQAVGSSTSVVKIRRIQALSGGVAVIGTANSIIRVSECIAGPSGQLPATNFWRFDQFIGELLFQFLDKDGNVVSLADPATFADLPSESDVRDKTLYAHGDREGTLKVPTAGQTAKDVPVDDTLGEAVLTPAGVSSVISEILLSSPQSQIVTFAATSGGDPVSGLIVRIAGRQFVTSTNGQFAVPLDPGEYPAELIAPSGFLPLDTIVVTVANQPVVVPITLTPIGYPAEDAPFSNVLLPVINGYGQGVPGVTISLEFLGFDAGATPPAVVIPPLAPLTTGVHGLTNAKLLRFGRYRANYSFGGRAKVREFVVPDSGTFQVVEPI